MVQIFWREERGTDEVDKKVTAEGPERAPVWCGSAARKRDV